jgi:hypothetical protein
MAYERVTHGMQLGMPWSDVQKNAVSWEEILVLENPGQLSPGYSVGFNDGLSYLVMLDEATQRVIAISTNDASPRLRGGLGVGSSFADVKHALDSIAGIRWPGYGTLVGAGNDTWLAFETTEPLRADDRVRWIEVRSDLSPYALQ